MIEIKRNVSDRPNKEKLASLENGIGQSNTQEKLKPFLSIDGSNYRTVYRAVCNFHERNNPPRLEDDNGTKYWEVVADDMMAIANQFDNNPFVVAMLTAVFEELERQFKELPATRVSR